MKYCVYLTVYSGNLLPPFYIGYSSVDNVENGYRGSVSSKLYKSIWKEELKNNSQAFKTKIISTHKTRAEAKNKETVLIQKLNAVSSPMYINRHDGSGRNFFHEGPFSVEHKTKLKESFARSPLKKSTQLQNLKNVKTKGKTYEEIYGIEKAAELKEQRRLSTKRNWQTETLRNKMSVKHKTEGYRLAALKRWADPTDRAKRCAAMIGVKKSR